MKSHPSATPEPRPGLRAARSLIRVGLPKSRNVVRPNSCLSASKFVNATIPPHRNALTDVVCRIMADQGCDIAQQLT
jgi:hypothetical protein